MRKVLLGVVLVAVMLGAVLVQMRPERARRKTPVDVATAGEPAAAPASKFRAPPQASRRPSDGAPASPTQASAAAGTTPGPATASESSAAEAAPGDDEELWNAVQATPEEREVARQENVRESAALDEATEDMNNDKLNASQYGARIREIGLYHRQRMVEIFGEDRAQQIRDIYNRRAEQFFEEKYSKQ